MQENDPSLDDLIRRADEQHLIDDYHVSGDVVTLRVGAQDLEMTPIHATLFLEGLLAGFRRAMQHPHDDRR